MPPLFVVSCLNMAILYISSSSYPDSTDEHKHQMIKTIYSERKGANMTLSAQPFSTSVPILLMMFNSYTCEPACTQTSSVLQYLYYILSQKMNRPEKRVG